MKAFPGIAVPALAAAAAIFAGAPAALAHPHVFIDAKADLVFDADGRLAGVRHAWRFDEGYSAFASEGLDADGDGKLTTEELSELAQLNVDSMKDYDYFTFITVGDREFDLARPEEFWLQSDGAQLTLYFTVRPTEPVDVSGAEATVEVFDPTYYVSFLFVDDDPVTLDAAPDGCSFEVTRPEEMDPVAAQLLAGVGPDQRELPPDLQPLAAGQTNGILVKCP